MTEAANGWEGVIEAAAGCDPLEVIVLEAGGRTAQRTRGAAMLRLAEGALAELDVRAAQLSGFAATTERGRWASLEPRWGALFAGDAPGPHVTAIVRVMRIPAGAAVVVRGRTVGPAGAAERIVAETVTSAIARRAPRPERRGPTLTWIVLATMAVAFAALAVRTAWQWAHSPSDPGLHAAMAVTVASLLAEALVIAMFAFGIASSTQRLDGDWLPSFVGEDQQLIELRSGATTAVVIALVVGAIALFFVQDAAGEIVDHGLYVRGHDKFGHPGNSAIVVLQTFAIGYSAATAAALLASWWARRHTARRLRALLGHQAASWQRVAGTVVRASCDGAPYRHVHAYGPTSGGKSSSTWTKGTGETHAFTIASAGREIEIGSGAVWASTFRRASADTSARLPVFHELTALPIGAQVLAAGRLTDDDPPAMRATGTETLLLFATDQRGPNARNLRVRLAVHDLLPILATLILGGAALTARF